MERRQILVFIRGLGLGGAEKLIAEAARFWDRGRFRYRVAYVLPWKDQLVGDLEGEGVEVACIGGRSGTGVSSWGRLRALSKGSDLVHAHLPSSGVMARLGSAVPVVYTEHNLAASYRPLTRWANRVTYGRNAAVIAVSQSVADSLVGYPGPAPRVIPNGVAVSADQVAVLAIRGEMGGGAPLVVHVGNIRPHKGHYNLIEAARHLRMANPSIRVLSAGGEKHVGDLERVRAEATRLGVDDVLTFLGRRADAAELIAAADVFVSPADFEGLPVSVLEAMALGTPVVSTAVGGVPSVVRHRHTGLLVEPGDPRSLADAVLELLDDRDLAAGLAAAARDLVGRDHGMETMVRATEAVYKGVLGGL